MFKIKAILTKGEKIKTTKGITTNWTFLEDVEFKTYKTSKKRIIKCKCLCGKICNVQYNNIRSGTSKSCNMNSCKTVPNLGKGKMETSYNCLYDNYRRGAIKRKYEFNISKEEFKLLISENCYYCDRKPEQLFRILNAKTKKIRAGIPIIYNGIDRINNDKGYLLNNCVSCCGICNSAKSNKNQKDFLLWIKKIYKNLKLN